MHHRKHPANGKGKDSGPCDQDGKEEDNEELRLIFPQGKTPNQAIWTKIKKQVLHVKWEAVFFNGDIGKLHFLFLMGPMESRVWFETGDW